jgi:glycosyltransferase involved in cell wall biosynthesis
MSYAPILTEPSPILNAPTNTSNLSPNSIKSAPLTRRNKSSSSNAASRGQSETHSFIVHCHLSWDWVWQRPQQFISRLGKNHKVLFVETAAPDPELASPMARFKIPQNLPNITILRLQFPAWRWGDGDYVDAERRRLVREFVNGPAAGQFENPVQWFYDPMAAPAFAGQMGEKLIVYDCMDELSKFRCAPPEIIEREAGLLERADVVFTGGYKLFESKRRHNPNCHFYGCGVDSRHFGKARLAETAVSASLAALPKPVLGFFGVVDERMDYDLLARLADAEPNWSIAIIGPVLKVEANSLPQRPNLHWLGAQSYDDLPSFCKGFNVCLMPFALNEATEFINPTKTLEYMATGRPIVSTAVPDVVRNFGSIANIARSADEFIASCRQAVAQPDASAIERGLKMAGENSWEAILARMEGDIADALLKKRSVAYGEPRDL